MREKCPTDKDHKPSSSLFSNTDPLPTAIQQQKLTRLMQVLWLALTIAI
jgi:hypothetical protein